MTPAQSAAGPHQAPPVRTADLARWFGPAGERRSTVSDWRIDRFRTAPESAEPLPRTAAWFAACTMLHAGVFSGRQVDRWLEHHDHGWPAGGTDAAVSSYRQRFLTSFFTPRFSGHPLAVMLRFPGGAKFGHFVSRPGYAAIGVENSRYRRTAAMPLVMQRLLAYDFLLERPDLGWMGEAEEKLKLFDALGVPRSALPQRVYKAGSPPGGRAAGVRSKVAGQTVKVPDSRRQYFPDHMPIGYGPWRLVFVIPCPPDDFAQAAARAREQEALWRALRALGVRVTVVFALRQPPDAALGAPGALDGFMQGAAPSAPPDPADRERLLAAVERHVLTRADNALRARLERLHAGAGSSVDARAAALDAQLKAGPAPAEADGPPAKPGPMEVSAFISQRLSAPLWNIKPPAPLMVDR